jgi:hypothetical protein
VTLHSREGDGWPVIGGSGKCRRRTNVSLHEPGRILSLLLHLREFQGIHHP